MARAAADAGYKLAASRLAEPLTDRGDLDGAEQVLRAAADAGDTPAAFGLVGVLADSFAAFELAELLADRGDLDRLRARADASDRDAAFRLTDLPIEQGSGEETERLRRFGLNPDGSIACE